MKKEVTAKLARLTASILLASTALISPSCGGSDDLSEEDIEEIEEFLDEAAFEGDLSDDVMEVTGVDEALEIEEYEEESYE
jgi:hypothetical protein